MIAGWEQVIAIFIGNLSIAAVMIGVTIAMFKWSRTEASEDRREMLQMIRNTENEISELRRANDAFIYRLLNIESKIDANKP